MSFNTLCQIILEKLEVLLGVDKLAELMLNPDENFNELKQIWDSNRDYRILYGSLL